LASSTKKREGETTSSLRFFLNLIIIVIFTLGIAVSHPHIFYSWRRKRRVNDRSGVSKPIDACTSR
jgi:ABC-type uncharacterized transport system substrate-binding protein